MKSRGGSDSRVRPATTSSHPAEPPLELLAGRLDHGGVQADSGHRGERRRPSVRSRSGWSCPRRSREAGPVGPGPSRPGPSRPGPLVGPGPVEQGQVDPAVPAVEARAHRPVAGRAAQRPRGQVRGAEQIASGTPVPASASAQAQATVPSPPAANTRLAPAATARRVSARPSSASLVGTNHGFQPRSSAAKPAAPQEPPRIAEQRPVDHERDHGHASFCAARPSCQCRVTGPGLGSARE